MTTVKIPSLGTTANEILDNALAYPCAGYSLRFEVIGEGVYCFDRREYYKLIWQGNIPYRIEMTKTAAFENWLLQQIAMGVCAIWVRGTGRNPRENWELHRARGTPIPLQ